MRYFRIKNWEKYQHRDALRGDGPMKFIRLNTDIFSDPKLSELTTNQRLTWIGLLCISGRTRNKLPYNSTWTRHELRLKHLPNLALFEELGLIEVFDASTNAAKMPPRVEKSRVEQRKEEPSVAIAPPPSSDSPKKVSSKIENFIALWNTECGSLPKITSFYFPERMRTILKVLKDFPDFDYWKRVFSLASGSDFLTGKVNDFKASLDWILKNSNHVKIYEGNFDNAKKLNKAQERLRSNLEIGKKILESFDEG